MGESLLRSIGNAFKTFQAWIGAVFTAAAAAEDMGMMDHPIPSWVFWSVAVLSLFWLVIKQQMELSESPYIAKLKHRSYVSFGEICDAVPRAHEEYDKRDVHKALMKAAGLGHFSGFEVTERNDQGQRVPGNRRVRVELADFLDYRQTKKTDTPGKVAFANATKAARGKPNGLPEDFLIITRSEFRRWYSRLRDHAYER